MKSALCASLAGYVLAMAAAEVALAQGNHRSLARDLAERFALPTLPDAPDPFWYDQNFEPWVWRPALSWTATAEALFLHRSMARPLGIAFGSSNEELLNVADLRFNHEPGARLHLICHRLSGYDLDVAYFGIGAWNSTALVNTPGAQLRVFDGFAVLFPFTVSYGSELHSTEISLRRKVNPWLTGLVGYRWVEFHEELVVMNAVSLPPVLLADTDNHLHGFQLGAEARLWDRGGRLRVEGWLKAGVYHDSADLAVSAPQVDREISARDGHSAFLGEIGIHGEYRLARSLAFRAGYQAIWLEGVSLVPDQSPEISFVDGGTLNGRGSLFLHGVFFGLSARW